MDTAIDDVARHSEADPGIAEQVIRAGASDAAAEIPEKPRRLGILYAEESGRGLTHPFFAPMLDAIKNEAEAHGYDISFINRQVTANGGSYLAHSRLYELDGVCLVCVDFSAPEIRELVMSGIPCVTVDHFFRGVPAVISDNETGVQKLVEYAISRGHRRIAFVHGHNNSVVTRMRIQQFENTMSFYDLPVPAEYVREGEYDNIEMTRRIVDELLRLPERPTCILLPDDTSFLGAQEAARENGLRIPWDISFSGYDGISLSQALEPKLTTIRQDCEKIGMTAARTLISMIEKPGSIKPRPLIFPVEFMRGGTVGDAPRGN